MDQMIELEMKDSEGRTGSRTYIVDMVGQLSRLARQDGEAELAILLSAIAQVAQLAPRRTGNKIGRPPIS